MHKALETQEVKDQEKAIYFDLASLIPSKANVRGDSELPEMENLMKSIKAEGIIQPITACPAQDETGKAIEGKYTFVAGHRRYFAAKMLKLKTVPVRLVSADASRQHRMALIENLQREDMSPIDKALGIKKMIDDEWIDQKDIATALGVSPGFVSQHLALLKLPKQMQAALRSGKLELTQARHLGRIEDEEVMLTLMKDAPNMTNAQLQTKVEAILNKKERSAAKKSAKGAKGAKSDGKPEKLTRAEFYAEIDLAPVKKDDLRELLVEYGGKLDRSDSEEKQHEYRLILKGLTLAAGVKAKS